MVDEKVRCHSASAQISYPKIRHCRRIQGLYIHFLAMRVETTCMLYISTTGISSSLCDIITTQIKLQSSAGVKMVVMDVLLCMLTKSSKHSSFCIGWLNEQKTNSVLRGKSIVTSLNCAYIYSFKMILEARFELIVKIEDKLTIFPIPTIFLARWLKNWSCL